MLAESPLVFDEPRWLFLLLLIIPAFLLSLRSIGGLSRTKAITTFTIRSLVILLLTMALAHPSWEKRGEGVTTTVILDRSLSVPYALRKQSVTLMQRASESGTRMRDDRIAVITVARDASISAMPDAYSAIEVGMEPADLKATNLAAAIRLALAIGPADTANRIVLVSDGNETMDNVRAAGDLAAAQKVPVDVVLIKYEHETEVIFERLVAPAHVRRGQTANLKMVVRSQTQATGTITLTINGETIDINGAEPGAGRAVALEPGPAFVLQVPLSMDDPGPQQFVATLDLDGEGDLPENNRAVAVTFVGGEGRVLCIDRDPEETKHLIAALEEADIAVDRASPDQLGGGLVFLTGYDAIVLANMPRYDFDEEQDKMLHAYVHDLGGGLVMLGGPESLGAGGWIDSQVARVLPVELDPPSIRQMPRGAMALIMHSCEMPQGNFWGQRVAQAAIEALSRLDYVGILEYNWGAINANQGVGWAFPLQEVGDKSAAIAASKQMVVGDMPDFQSSMTTALTGLQSVNAGQKHVVIISDGDPAPASAALLNQYVAAKVTVTTVMVGGHGTMMDQNSMRNVATKTGGRFYNVTNPKQLPQIFIKEAQMISRSLIQEGDLYQPQVVSRMPGPVEGIAAVPAIEGYVLSAPRKGLAQTPIVVATSEGNDPIYANWNYGLGKSIAYTSDLAGRWGSRWTSWSEFQSFWEQSIRWVMRPSSPSNLALTTRLDGDLAVVELEALDADASFLNFLQTGARVIAPSGTTAPLTLQQTGPGHYRAEFTTDEPGAYLVNVSYAGGTTDEPMQGHMQAAVSVPYSREFRAISHNSALLKELATRTGGRWLDASNPEILDLFERESLEVPRSRKRIWDLLAIIAAALFIIDVASRRLAVDPKWLRGLLGRASSRRTESGTDTVSAWKRTKAQVERSRDAQTERTKQAKARFEADESDAATAIDVGAAKQDTADPLKAKGAATRPAAEAEKSDEEDSMSRLLRAKRRAIDEENEGKEGEDG